MDKAIDKGNLIDFFAVLLPGMVGVILTFLINLPSLDIDIGKDVMSSIIVLLVLLLSSYIAGLLLIELAVVFQKLFPSIFDYYREAIKKDALKDEKTVLFEFLVFKTPFPCLKDNPPWQLKPILDLVEQKEMEFENKEFWLLTHNFMDQIERKKAYCMMNRSLVMVPFAFMIVQAFIVHLVKIGTCPVCWQKIMLLSVGLLLYVRARRQAVIFYHEVNRIYECALKKYLIRDK